MSKNLYECMDCRHRICAKRIPIFTNLDQEEINRVISLIVRRRYAKGELIIMQGERLEGLIIISQGQVKVFRNSNEGREHILYFFSEGDFFGEKNLIRNQAATYSVEALEDTSICMIRKSDFQKLLENYPSISIKILEELCSRMDRLESIIENMGAKNVEERVSSVLLEFAEKHGKEHPKGIMVELPLSREGIANYIGLARETVSRKLKVLQDEGVIEMVGNKKVIVLDINALEKSRIH